jgi:hypothetical protein
MKNKILSIIAIGATLLTYSCKNPDGSVEPASNAGVAETIVANGSTNKVYGESKSLLIDKVLSGTIKGRVTPIDCTVLR